MQEDGREIPPGVLDSTGAVPAPSRPAMADYGDDGDGGEVVSEDMPIRAKRVSRLLADLAKTARSFLLYDPRNQAIHGFLSTLLDRFVTTLQQEGELRLQFQAFEIWFEGEAVYLNRDREKSLAFRLYRDGIRALVLQSGFTWEELVKLLEVLSIRYSGVHQNEDDAVTLLWKGNFQHMEIVAVEGFVPDEEEEVIDVRQMRRHAGGTGDQNLKMPDSVDMPRPHLPRMAKVEWLEVDAHRLEELQTESSGHALPEDCVYLAERLWEQMNTGRDPLTMDDVGHVLHEMLVFLMSEEHLASLLKYLLLLESWSQRESPPQDPSRSQALASLLSSVQDDRSVAKLIHSVSSEESQLNPDWIPVVSRLSVDPLLSLLTVVPAEHSIAGRQVGRQLLEHFGRGQVDKIQARFKGMFGTAAVDLLKVIVMCGGDGVAPFVAQQCTHSDDLIRDEALRILLDYPYSGQVGRALFDAFKMSDGARRLRLLEKISLTGDRRFVEQLGRFVEERGDHISLTEGEHIGRVVGQLGGEKSLPRWQEWLRVSGFFRKTLEGPAIRNVVAGFAVATVPGDAAAAMLAMAAKGADDKLKEPLQRAITLQQAVTARGKK